MMIQARFSRILTLLGLSFAAASFGNEALAQTAFLDEREEAFELARDQSSANSNAFTFEGTVHLPDGTPNAGAVVVSSAGGQAVTDEHGKYRLESRVPTGAEHIEITAVGGTGGKLVANQQVLLSAASGTVSVAPLHLAQSSGCTPSWLPEFGGEPGTNGNVRAMTVFDDGDGPALYIGGDFTTVRGVLASYIAKWDGSNWTPVGGGVSSWVFALTVFDDGNGEALYAAGFFLFAGGVQASRIAKWDGSNWSPLDSGMDTRVVALAVFDDGNGEQLYAGGRFQVAGGVPASNIAKWDGSSWAPVSGGTNLEIYALRAFDDGNGECLFVGGRFSSAGGVALSGFGKWDGSNWGPVGNGPNSGVSAMTVFDDGNGEQLVVGGGSFSTAGSMLVNRVAQWDGSSWTVIGTGIDGSVTSLAVFNDGSGDRLIAGGKFFTVENSPAGFVAQWDGSSWTPLDSGVRGGHVKALAAFDDGNGELLFVGGTFTTAGGEGASHLATWDGSNWSAISAGVSGPVRDLLVFDDGNGDRLYAAGDFTNAGGGTVNGIASWNGSSWSPLGSGVDGNDFIFERLDEVHALAKFDDGSGTALYAAGHFVTAGGVTVNNIAKWDGSSWSPLGSGLTDFGYVYALAVFNNGNGDRLIAGGIFTTAGGVPANRIAKWNGSSWAPLGSGTTGPVYALKVFNYGTGDRLIAGGHFAGAGGMLVSSIAKWNGSSWVAVGGVRLNASRGTVSALSIFDDGNGERLIVGGSFTATDGVPAASVASWDGSNWAALGNGITPTSYGSGHVYSLGAFDDGNGERLFAGGNFKLAGGAPATHIASWDGSNWAKVGRGMKSYVRALTVFDDGGGAALYAGGDFSTAFDSGDSYIAKWACASAVFDDFCNGDGGDQLGCTDCPCMNNSAPGTIGGCLNSAATSASLIATGNPSVSLSPMETRDLRFSLTGAPPAAFTILNSGNGLAPGGMAIPCFGLNSGVQSTQFDGLRCAIMNTRRHGGRAADSNGDVGVTNDPWGGEGGPPVGIAQQGVGFASGQTRYFQVIYRDDALLSCMRGLNTSQAIEVTFTP